MPSQELGVQMKTCRQQQGRCPWKRLPVLPLSKTFVSKPPRGTTDPYRMAECPWLKIASVLVTRETGSRPATGCGWCSSRSFGVGQRLVHRKQKNTFPCSTHAFQYMIKDFFGMQPLSSLERQVFELVVLNAVGCCSFLSYLHLHWICICSPGWIATCCNWRRWFFIYFLPNKSTSG